ncbi:helix-turn-helix domain-containing protein [Filomicrobium sp.]|uniref:helix-turn-helix domain-containing protein n=1 Tax=Filomicrobium sp. TaxID=2024831 RepID=UPI00258AD684|nr:helix-turn-helix domain-containing protein [Filomicrobium sp.]MCV0371632.1 helix-turn-helix domain-containing protein [Filomicrobium sp.]
MNDETELTPAGQWYRNRDEWIRHVLGRDYLTADCQRVGIFIAMHMNRRDNHTKHQQKTIAKDLNLSIETVKRSVKKLREEGLIDRDQVMRGRRNRAVNLYWLVFPWQS